MGVARGPSSGVLPPDFVLVNRSTNRFHGRNFSSRKENRTAFNVWSIARLKAGLALKEAQAGSDVFSRRLAESYPNIHAGWHVVLIPVSEEASGNLRGPLLLLLAASGVVLLIVLPEHCGPCCGSVVGSIDGVCGSIRSRRRPRQTRPPTRYRKRSSCYCRRVDRTCPGPFPDGVSPAFGYRAQARRRAFCGRRAFGSTHR